MKVKRLKGEKVKGLRADGKPKMTAEQKAVLAACKSFDADVERAKYIWEISTAVARERCKTCCMSKDCEGRVSIPCLIVAVASVAIGMNPGTCRSGNGRQSTKTEIDKGAMSPSRRPLGRRASRPVRKGRR